MTATQNERLLAHLQKHEVIQPLYAWQLLGIYRLGARIYDLRQAGHAIDKETVTVRNQFGEECRVAQYRMVKAGGTA